MQAIDLLLTRRSARNLGEPGPDQAALELILASATRAPDHGRLRPWRFVVIRGAARERFGALLAEYLKRSHPTSSAETLEREAHKAYRAPLIVAVAARYQEIAKIPDVEQLLSAGAAAHAMMLAARALGFNAMWKTGAPAYDSQVKSGLGLSPQDAIAGFIYLGSESGEPAAHSPADWQGLVSELSP